MISQKDFDKAKELCEAVVQDFRNRNVLPETDAEGQNAMFETVQSVIKDWTPEQVKHCLSIQTVILLRGALEEAKMEAIRSLLAGGLGQGGLTPTSERKNDH